MSMKHKQTKASDSEEDNCYYTCRKQTADRKHARLNVILNCHESKEKSQNFNLQLKLRYLPPTINRKEMPPNNDHRSKEETNAFHNKMLIEFSSKHQDAIDICYLDIYLLDIDWHFIFAI